MTGALPFAHGGPLIRGILRHEPLDFRVEEILGFEPSGQGEHAFVLIEKTEANTDWVARQLAEFAGVAPIAVGYAGLKDRHAVTRQAFTVQLPGRADPNWRGLSIAGVRVICASRHDRKLKRGAHRANRFHIRLRNPDGDRDAVAVRLSILRECGAPNYFGEQRFGRGGNNLGLAAQLFAGKRMPRAQRGFALSAARSEIFNRILQRRVEDGSWNRALDGDVWMLAGTHAIFGPEQCSDDLVRRGAALDIHATGPLWGRGELRSTGQVARLERELAAQHESFAAGLERAGLEQERRALRLVAMDLEHEWEPDGSLLLQLQLGVGAFATTLLRELCDWGAGQAQSG